MALLQPLRQALQPVFADLVTRLGSFMSELRAAGGYSGSSNQTVSKNNPWVTNPWGAAATTLPSQYAIGVPSHSPVYLKAGQSYNYLTGQFTDPKLSQGTAQGLNNATLQRRANETGAEALSSRSTKSALAQLDEMYAGNFATASVGSSMLSNVNLANESDLGKPKTILGGSAAKTAVKPPAARALS